MTAPNKTSTRMSADNIIESNRIRDRRLFLQAGAAIAAGVAANSFTAAAPLPAVHSASQSPSETIRVGVMGVNGRGSALAKGFIGDNNCEIQYVCDVDARAAERAQASIVKTQKNSPQIVTDFRRILDDSTVDVLVVATPNHWHAPATILACAAGKHVYVEKPCSYSGEEGEWAVAAARKHKRVVQLGTQRRSWPALIEGIGKLHAGEIGEILYSRTWYNNRRGTIGTGNQVPVPEWLDWSLWQGPAPEVPYKDNVVHYNWHWLWQWGNGELGNNGIHGLDVARWGLGVTFPSRVVSGGGKYRHNDDQETPDTMMVTYDFPEKKTITWEGLSWSALGPHDSQFGISFHGTEGSMILRDSGYTVVDLKNKEIATQTGAGGDADHIADFLDAIRSDRLPNADIEQAHRSTLLCHLGNIAYRSNSVLVTDPANGHIQDNAGAQAMWGREYAGDWRAKLEACV